MSLKLMPIDSVNDAEHLVSFLSSNFFPFHLTAAPTEEEARDRLANGVFSEPDNLAYWIELDGVRVGFINFQEVLDGTPMIDIRLGDPHRGRSIAVAALGIGTSEVFNKYPDVNRIEGNTRSDNIAMRKVFERNCYVKEAHYRKGWPVVNADSLDSVAYAIIRCDWESGLTTPVDWNS
ncbi:GNAT family N-acetyltransferase [Brevibacterium sandarakinum]|nr:GNAT family protein [Brevibacterium sandarakinum]